MCLKRTISFKKKKKKKRPLKFVLEAPPSPGQQYLVARQFLKLGHPSVPTALHQDRILSKNKITIRLQGFVMDRTNGKRVRSGNEERKLEKGFLFFQGHLTSISR
jgi:hypothetical protein